MVNQCPGFISSWLDRVFVANWDPVSRMISDFHRAAQTCGIPADANCRCEAGKVKVYDDDDDTFHCKTEPPAAGCPKWDQTFDFDPNVWACVGGVVSRNWSAISQVTYAALTGSWGDVSCASSPYNVRLNSQLFLSAASSTGNSPWQYATSRGRPVSSPSAAAPGREVSPVPRRSTVLPPSTAWLSRRPR